MDLQWVVVDIDNNLEVVFKASGDWYRLSPFLTKTRHVNVQVDGSILRQRWNDTVCVIIVDKAVSALEKSEKMPQEKDCETYPFLEREAK